MRNHSMIRFLAILLCAMMAFSAMSIPTLAEETDPAPCAHGDTITREEAGTAATCVSEGSYTVITVCADCGDELSRNTVTEAALGHAYSSSSVSPTCTEAGRVTYTCSRCGDSYTENGEPALGHDYRQTGRTEASCGKTGFVTYTCSRCGDSYTEELAALSHDYQKTVTAPSCTEAGKEIYTCSRCGDSYEVALPALNHAYGASINPPTCTEAGATVYTCERCGDTYTETGAPAVGHDYRETARVDASYEAEGSVTYTCARCGDSYTETLPRIEKPAVPFEQIETVDGVKITVAAAAGVFDADARLKIAKTKDDDFARAAETALGIEAGETLIVRHDVYSLSGAEMNGAAQVKLEDAGFRQLAVDYPEGVIAAYVLYYDMEAEKVEDAAVRIAADADLKKDSVTFTMAETGLYDLVTVIRLPEKVETLSDGAKNAGGEEKTGDEEKADDPESKGGGEEKVGDPESKDGGEEKAGDPESKDGGEEKADDPESKDGDAGDGEAAGVEEMTLTESVSLSIGMDNDALFEGYIRRELPGLEPIRLRYAGGVTQLGGDGLDLVLYTYLRGKVAEVAAGNLNSTCFTIETSVTYSAKELGVESLYENGSISQNANGKLRAKVSQEFHAAMQALCADSPYDLYWYDNALNPDILYSIDYNLAIQEVRVSLCVIRIPVEPAFRPAGSSSQYDFDTNIPARVTTARERINQIVGRYNEASLLNRLIGYKQEICNLVEYNHPAAKDDYDGSREAWQLVYIFDGDPETKVVCEGYAKAFKYLCDLSKDECITMTGYMGVVGHEDEGGGHMWNVVHIDGKYYLVDVTNCDSGAVGSPDYLFLKGYVSYDSSQHLYVYQCSGGDRVLYVIDGDTLSTYPSEWMEWSKINYGTATTVHVVYIAHSDEGTLEASPSAAKPGDTVTLIATPKQGYALASLTVLDANNNRIQVNNNTFTMPNCDVTVTTEWEAAKPAFDQSHALLLSNEICVRFLINLPEGFEADGSYMDFSVSDGRTGRMAFAEAEKYGENSYWFTCRINALELADTITATYHFGTQGETVADTYSAMTYINLVRERFPEQQKLIGLVNALQNYGYYMQQSGWRDGREHTQIAKQSNCSSIETARNGVSGQEIIKQLEGSGIEDVKFSLTLNAQTIINVFFKPESGVAFSSGYVGTTTLNGGTYYQINTAKIGPRNLGKMYTITAKTDSGTAEVKVSAMSYVYAVLATNSAFTEAQQYAMAAYYDYWRAANAY